jgi:hypothetical protein
MKILFYDIIQETEAPKELKSPALADKWVDTSVDISLDEHREISGIGIGNTDAEKITITFKSSKLDIIEGDIEAKDAEIFYDSGDDQVEYELEIDSEISQAAGPMTQTIIVNGDGLYRIKPVIADSITISHDGTYLGRFGAGVAVDLRTAIAKEPGWVSTAECRKTLSGQVIPGAGGYTYRVVSLDTRYKIGREAVDQIALAFKSQIGLGYPFFIMFDTEAERLPFLRLYAQDPKIRECVLQGGIGKYLFSHKFTFEECF